MVRLLPLAMALSLAATPAMAQTLEPDLALRDLMHARDYAMGGAYRANGLGTEAVYGNPAALALYKRYQVELSGAWDPGRKTAFGTISVLDSATTDVAAGLAYHYATFGQGADRVNANLTTLALNVPLGNLFFLGVSGHYINLSGARSVSGLSMDVAAMVKLFDALAISVVGYNLAALQDPTTTRYWALSAAWLAGIFTLDVDVRADFGIRPGGPTLAYSGGAEYVVGGGMPLRVGYQYDSLLGASFVSAGIGFISDSAGLDLAYRHEIGAENGRMLALTLRYQVQ